MITENKTLIELTLSRAYIKTEEANVVGLLENKLTLKTLHIRGEYSHEEIKQKRKEECIPKGWNLIITNTDGIAYNDENYKYSDTNEQHMTGRQLLYREYLTRSRLFFTGIFTYRREQPPKAISDCPLESVTDPGNSTED